MTKCITLAHLGGMVQILFKSLLDRLHYLELNIKNTTLKILLFIPSAKLD
jgi:hypothetical protein